MDNFTERFKEIRDQGYQLDIKGIYRRAWNIFRQQTFSFIGITALSILICFLLDFIPKVGGVIGIIFTTYVGAGIYIYALKIIRKDEVSFIDFFKGGPDLLSLILLGLLSGLLTFLGMIIIVPGVYLVVGYLLATLFVIDRKMGVWDAMEYSRKIVTLNWISFFIFGISTVGVLLLGILFLGVGALVAIPFIHCLFAVCYHNIVYNGDFYEN